MKRLIIGIIIIAGFSGTQPLAIRNWYVDATGGNDANTGLDSFHAFRTIAHLNLIVPGPSDSVLFKCNESYYTSTGLTINSSGGSSSKIVYSSWSTGRKPIIKGFTDLSFTQIASSNKYASQALTNTAVNLVEDNVTPIEIARWPNSDAAYNGGWQKVTSSTWDGTSAGSITSDSVAAAPAAVDKPRLILRARRWIIDNDSITASIAGTSINFKTTNTSGQKYSATNGFGWFLMDDSAYLNKNREWYQSSITKRIIVVSTSGVPTNMRAAEATNLIDCGSFSNLVFDNLDLQGATDYLFDIAGSGITIQNCSLDGAGKYMINYASGTSLNVTNNIMTNSMDDGIYVNGTNAYIGYNTMQNIGLFAGMGGSSDGHYQGIRVKASNSLIEYNTITNVGYTGIFTTDAGGGGTVQFNVIDNFCLIATDGGGIYYIDIGGSPVRRYCMHNITRNGGIDSYLGTTDPATLYNHITGLYCDQQTANVDIMYNSAHNVERGLFCNPGTNGVNAQWNTMWSCSSYAIYMDMGDNLDPDNFGNTFKHNIYYASYPTNVLGSTVYTGYFAGTLSAHPLSQLAAIMDSNLYMRPTGSTSHIHPGSGTTNLAGWQSASPFDDHSKESFAGSALSFASSAVQDTSILFVENDKASVLNYNVTATYQDVITGTNFTGGIITVQPFSTVVALKTSALGSVGGAPPVNLPNRIRYRPFKTS